MKHPLSVTFFAFFLAIVLASAGCKTSTKKKDFEVTVARFFMEDTEGNGFASVTLPVSGVQIAVISKPVVTEYDFTGVQLAESDLGKFLVFNLTNDATRDVYRVTGTNQGKRLVLFINDKPVGARVIDRAFNTGSISVFAALPDELLVKLAKNMNETSIDIQQQVEKAKK